VENENQKLKEEILDKVEDIDYNKVSPFTRDTTIQRKASEIQKKIKEDKINELLKIINDEVDEKSEEI
jgi:predicted transcriptional regulator